MTQAILLAESVLRSLLEFFSYNHPREGILLLHGKNTKKEIIINEIAIPPQAVHGENFSSFPIFMLPADPTLQGTAHSHPSGILKMSNDDFNHFYGKIMVIVGYPYLLEKNIAVFNRKGEQLKYSVFPDNP